MKKPVFVGSTVGVLLLFSIISYSQNLVQQQRSSKPNQEATQTAGTSAADTATANTSNPVASTERPREVSAAAPAIVEKAALSENFEATAYSLHGRTASGAPATTGVIAADPRLLPIGSRVRIEAGSYTGEYVVADTGGAVKGKRIDIWTPSSREAMRFGRRTVKLTVLHLAGKRGTKSTRPRTVTAKS
jgi:3D (Asp-Asp-Asp) domain-containing protein